MRVAVILHERIDTWARQLQPRLPDRPVRWFQTRTWSDLEAILPHLVCPVMLIDLSRNLVDGLNDLGRAKDLAPAARILVLNPEAGEDVPPLARELGATHVVSGFVPPPEVAELIARWIALAIQQAEREGWSRPLDPETPDDAGSWITAVVRDPNQDFGPVPD